MTWLDIKDSQFGLEALPYATFRTAADPAPRLGARIGDLVLDVAAVTGVGEGGLDALLAAGPAVWKDVRAQLTRLLSDPASEADVRPHLVPIEEAELLLPFTVADYVDFYASEHHASNVGKMFRPDSEPLTPNWKHLPIGYHGRSGTVVVSGTEVVRPTGLRKTPDGIVDGPSIRLDIEAEMGFVVGVGSDRGTPVPLTEAADHIFGITLLNDWSARDIQAWEYVPLGPFLGKSFATSISPWVLPLAALEAARVSPPERDVPLTGYLDDSALEPWALDLALEVRLNGSLVSEPPYATMYWTAPQMLAHMTANGASLRVGDLFASGTISGPDPGQRGSFLELSWSGAEPFKLDDGSTRTFLEDGDEVTITATAPAPGGGRIALGEVSGRILPAKERR
ncbi:fumarylacetoacetate hydrolase [Nocardioides sp. YR527]|uniref:fumarylacetoacetase n=1 Tax=Nocardioides sp. YR527 TaxID=1881028 RepID=UPI0008904320|nr:fumarylacetoacetase [Nocardioides sp. YR527]SDK51886.1 fumarylacetoacetate hydrolase [Nocardioides sp. YR527]